jgi:acyl dehydratase
VRYAPHHFEDLEPGRAFECGTRRLTREDIDQFTKLSGDRTRLHSDDAYAAGTPFGRVVAHGALNLAVATGLAYESGIFDGTVLAIAAMSIVFERPVFPEDSLTMHLLVQSRDERPRPDRGRVVIDVRLTNQNGRDVMSGAWTILMRRKAATTSGAT